MDVETLRLRRAASRAYHDARTRLQNASIAYARSCAHWTNPADMIERVGDAWTELQASAYDFVICDTRWRDVQRRYPTREESLARRRERKRHGRNPHRPGSCETCDAMFVEASYDASSDAVEWRTAYLRSEVLP